MLAAVPKPPTADRSTPQRTPARRENRIVPLYHQVEQVIRHRIATRQYDSGPADPLRARARARAESQPRHDPRGAARAGPREPARQGPGQGHLRRAGPARRSCSRSSTTASSRISTSASSSSRSSTSTWPACRSPTRSAPSCTCRPRVKEIVQIKRCRHGQGEPFSFTINYLPDRDRRPRRPGGAQDRAAEHRVRARSEDPRRPRRGNRRSGARRTPRSPNSSAFRSSIR